MSELIELRKQAANCTACELYAGVNRTAFGAGRRGASIVLGVSSPGPGGSPGQPLVGPLRWTEHRTGLGLPGGRLRHQRIRVPLGENPHVPGGAVPHAIDRRPIRLGAAPGRPGVRPTPVARRL